MAQHDGKLDLMPSFEALAFKTGYKQASPRETTWDSWLFKDSIKKRFSPNMSEHMAVASR